MDYFRCINCGKEVSLKALGTENRNHCPFCLWSKHLDQTIPGDRKSLCHGAMKPLGLIYKAEGGRKLGELCLVHECQNCGITSKNRIAGDDDPKQVLAVFKDSFGRESSTELLSEDAVDEVITQLFGKPNLEKYKKLIV